MRGERMGDFVGRVLFSVVVASLLGPADVGAQFTVPRDRAVDSVQPGARVRVSVASTFRQSVFSRRVERLRGTVRAVSPDTVYVELPNVAGAVAIPRASIRRVEISLGSSRRAGALQAGTIGAVILGLRMWVAHEDPRSRRFPEAWQAVAVGGAIGFGAGAWLGSRWPRERWRVARLPE
jgi:hypothetical protein